MGGDILRDDHLSCHRQRRRQYCPVVSCSQYHHLVSIHADADALRDIPAYKYIACLDPPDRLCPAPYAGKHHAEGYCLWTPGARFVAAWRPGRLGSRRRHHHGQVLPLRVTPQGIIKALQNIRILHFHSTWLVDSRM